MTGSFGGASQFLGTSCVEDSMTCSEQLVKLDALLLEYPAVTMIDSNELMGIAATPATPTPAEYCEEGGTFMEGSVVGFPNRVYFFSKEEMDSVRSNCPVMCQSDVHYQRDEPTPTPGDAQDSEPGFKKLGEGRCQPAFNLFNLARQTGANMFTGRYCVDTDVECAALCTETSGCTGFQVSGHDGPTSDCWRIAKSDCQVYVAAVNEASKDHTVGDPTQFPDDPATPLDESKFQESEFDAHAGWKCYVPCEDCLDSDGIASPSSFSFPANVFLVALLSAAIGMIYN